MTEVEQEKQLGLGAIMMTINRGKVSCNSSLTIFLVYSPQTPCIKNSKNCYAIEHVVDYFLTHGFVGHGSEPFL